MDTCGGIMIRPPSFFRCATLQHLRPSQRRIQTDQQPTTNRSSVNDRATHHSVRLIAARSSSLHSSCLPVVRSAPRGCASRHRSLLLILPTLLMSEGFVAGQMPYQVHLGPLQLVLSRVLTSGADQDFEWLLRRRDGCVARLIASRSSSLTFELVNVVTSLRVRGG